MTLNCALWEAWYVRIREGVLTLEGVSQHAQSRTADDRHLWAVLRMRPQPISCLLVFVMTDLVFAVHDRQMVTNNDNN